MEYLLPYLGRFHPLLVHLPIGILLVAVLFDLLANTKKYQRLTGSVSMLYCLGGIAAVFSCLSGYFLSLSGDYSGAGLQRHQWMGIAVAVVSLSIFILKSKEINLGKIGKYALPVLLAGMISFAGHWGGVLTHGEGYLNFNPQGSESLTIANVQEAELYQDIIQPILVNNCVKCHGSQKQKGKLRLDTPEYIAQGGKSGATIIENAKPEESELIRRLHLPLSDDEHMPPKKADALKEGEIKLLEWWISQGAVYKGQVKSFAQNESIAPILAALENPEKETKSASLFPEKDPGPVDLEAIAPLQDIRAVALPVGQNSNWLSVNFLNVDQVREEEMLLLEPLKDHIVWLKLNDSEFGDDLIQHLLDMPNLSKLYLDNTQITDQGLEKLTQLESLRYLNIVGTNTTEEGISKLNKLPNLEQLFIYQTNTNSGERKQLHANLAPVKVDTGGYIVPTLVSDTTLVDGK